MSFVTIPRDFFQAFRCNADVVNNSTTLTVVDATWRRFKGPVHVRILPSS